MSLLPTRTPSATIVALIGGGGAAATTTLGRPYPHGRAGLPPRRRQTSWGLPVMATADTHQGVGAGNGTEARQTRWTLGRCWNAKCKGLCVHKKYLPADAARQGSVPWVLYMHTRRPGPTQGVIVVTYKKTCLQCSHELAAEGTFEHCESSQQRQFLRPSVGYAQCTQSPHVLARYKHSIGVCTYPPGCTCCEPTRRS